MDRDERYRQSKRLVWGIFLIVLGSLFLLDRYGLVTIPHVGEMWPAVFFAIAAIRVLERRFGSAVELLALGAWFFICEFEWHGLTYRNSWPLLLIGLGVGIVIKAIEGDPWGRHGRRCRCPRCAPPGGTPVEVRND
jgi:hypothetical protein